MARSISEIKKEQTDLFVANEKVKNIYGLQNGKTFQDQFSPVSIESIFFYIVATAIWTLEKLFDIHKQEVSNIIANMKPHTARWYANVCKLFQYGDNLTTDSDKYNNEGKTDEEITASQIVTHAAVVEQEKRLLIKVAKNAGSDLAPLSADELTAFSEYIARVKDAGVQTQIISKQADDFKLALKIHFNPLVLNSEGQRIDGQSQTPVPDAIRTFLKELPFNGVLVLAYLIDALQKIEGVVIPTIVLAQYRYSNLEWGNIDVKYQPYAGYLRLSDNDLAIEFEAQSEIL